VGPGEVGEIVVESDFLSPGYWRRPDLTEAAFRPPAEPGGPRRYHTGDLGRLDAEGRLVCLGHKNARVKVRGHGVDLVEVETALRALPGLADAAVAAHQNRAGYAYLVGYVAPRALPGPTNAALREALRERLPDSMIPTTFVVLGALPRTASGKTDRQALPAPGRPYRDASRPATAPRTPTETAVAAVWAEVMRRDAVDVHDHFYDLGGESLQAMRIMARIRKTFGVDIDLQSLLDAPTVAELAQAVDERLGPRAASPPAEHDWSYLVTIQAGDGGRPVFLVPGGIGADGEFFVYTRLAHHVGSQWPFYGFKPRSAEGTQPAQASVQEMAADYLAELRARQPDGPYVIVGDCAGGIVAWELAQHLRAQGQRVARLILMDTPRPGGSWSFRYRSVGSYVRGLRYHRDQLRRLPGGEKLTYLRYRGHRWLLDLQSALGRHPVERTYSLAIHRYRPRPYDGRVALLVSEEYHRRGPTLGWDALAAGGLDVHPIPGDHHTCIREHVAAMAAVLRHCLA
jgi:thioesterase domain-containing protein/acyl carrier protein